MLNIRNLAERCMLQEHSAKNSLKLQSWTRRARDAATLLGSRRSAFVSNRRGQCNTPVARQRARAGDIAAVQPLP